MLNKKDVKEAGKLAKLKEFRQLYESQTTGSGHFPVCGDHYQKWSEEGSGVRDHGLLMHRGAKAGPGGAKQLKKLKLLLISVGGPSFHPPY